MPTTWIDPLARKLAAAAAFRGYALRPADWDDEESLFALHRDAMREYVELTWGWDEAWQREYFAATYAPARNAIIVRRASPARDVGRVSLTRHWRKILLRDIELIAGERGHGVGTAVVRAVLSLAHADRLAVELMVLKCNPAQRLYARLGFRVIGDDGERLHMRAA